MKPFKTPILKVTGLLALAILLAASCAKTPQDPDPNIFPNTFITSYSINITPDSSTYYGVTVYWRGSDIDGEPEAYHYWVENSGGAVLKDTVITETHATISLSFPNPATTYEFYAATRDNNNGMDPTPALVVIDMTDDRDITDPTFLPTTEATTVPPDGASTSRGVPFVVTGTDVDGIVTMFQWAIDNPTTWTQVVPTVITVSSSLGEFTLRPADLTFGPHVVYVRSIDNMGNVDPSPLSVSFICEPGYAPEVSLSVVDEQAFIVPFTDPIMTDFTVSFVGTVDFYYGAIDSFVVTTSEGQYLNTTDTEVNLGDLGSGAYWVNVTAYDAAGTSTSTGQVNFNIAELAAHNGVLCVNGIDWDTYGSEAVGVWDNGVPWGNRTHYKCWDLFDTTPLGSVPDMADSLLGTGSIPDWMFDTLFFDAISWFGNEYSGDDAYWVERETEIMAYLNMGGNLLLPVRYGADWFFDDLAAYCGIVADSWVSPDVGDSLTAKVGTLTNLHQRGSGQSLYEIPMTNNPDNLWIYEAENVAPGMHAGFITLPNGEGGGGAFCYIAGRNYRWAYADLKANADVILTTYFGVP